MRKKDLERMLEEVPPFPAPKESLEQYETPAEIAAEMLWMAFMAGDISGKIVIDLGCGTGRLATGAALLGARYVVCIDIDDKSLALAEETLRTRGQVPHDIVETDVRSAAFSRRLGDCTVVMNPPYGVKSRGSDIDFLRRAMELCDTIYSFHKVSKGLHHVVSEVAEKYGYEYSSVLIQDFRLRPSMEKHRKRSHYLKVALIIFKRK